MLNEYWFEWNGVRSTSFASNVSSLHVSKAIKFSSPKRKYTKYTVNGRNGDVFVLQDAYENMTISIEVFLYNIHRDPSSYKDLSTLCHNIAKWIYGPRGYAKLKLYGKDGYYLACYNGPFDVENTLYQFGKATINFDCRPENFLYETPNTYTSIPEANNGYWPFDDGGHKVQRIIYSVGAEGKETTKPIIAIGLNALSSISASTDARIILIVTDSVKSQGFTIRYYSFRDDVENNSYLVVDSEQMLWYVGKTPPSGSTAITDDLGLAIQFEVGSYVTPESGEGVPMFRQYGNFSQIQVDIRVETKVNGNWVWAGTSYPINDVKILPRWWAL